MPSTDKAIYAMLVQINNNLIILRSLLEEFKHYGIKIRTQEEHG